MTTTATASRDGQLAGHVRLIRAAADLIEQAGVPGLALFPWQDEIVIQVPEAAGDAAARIRSVALLAALAGCQAAPCPRPGGTRDRASARGEFAGHPVHVWTPVREEASS
jgi:hypothetical protein